MNACMSAGYICGFKEQHDGNQVVGAPRFVSQFVNSGENPFREFLSEVQPGCRLNITVTIEVLSSAKPL